MSDSSEMVCPFHALKGVEQQVCLQRRDRQRMLGSPIKSFVSPVHLRGHRVKREGKD